MQIPRKLTLAEALYSDIENNESINQLYETLLYNYSRKILNLDVPYKEYDMKAALRYADVLSKAAEVEGHEKYNLWGQEFAILLSLLEPEDERVKYILGTVLSNMGNYRGLKAPAINGFETLDVFDGLFYEYNKSELRIPGTEDEYFFFDQKYVYDNLKQKYFSYSGPTSMGKSFVVQTYVEQQVKNGSEDNFAILVPTKALINEVRSNVIGSLKGLLKEKNYRVVSSSGDLVLQQDHHFIFVMTPERMLYTLISMPDMKIDFLFIDEAHKISDRGGRSSYYYKVIAQLQVMKQYPSIIFASPNIPNPEVYLSIIPGMKKEEIHKLASKYTPVCQFKYYIDLCDGVGYQHNDYAHRLTDLPYDFTGCQLNDLINAAGAGKQNVVYCNARQKVVDYAVNYARNLPVSTDERLISLAKDIRNEVHNDCYLADLIMRGVAYHVGYLPSNIRLRIERSFEEGILRTIFCTSTLVEGVNLPADNIFITSYKNGNAKMDEVEFRNLVGRVGRIRYNLYGNVFFVRMDEKLKAEKYIDLMQKEIPPQSISLEIPENKKSFANVVADLVDGDISLEKSRAATTDKDYEALRKFALILTRDIAMDISTPVREMFKEVMTPEAEQKIKENFPIVKTSDDITLSHDQAESLRDLIVAGTEYPKLTGENDEVDFEELVSFMMKLRRVFKWDIYEKQTIGKAGRDSLDSVIRWYSVMLLRWIRGNGLSQIIYHALEYKEKHPYSGVWVGNNKLADVYIKESKLHKNYIIAETLGVIENVLLFSISNYFRKFSLEYKEFHGVDHFENDWYEFVEYGTTNPLTIFLQQMGYSREASTYIEQPANRSKYLDESGNEIRIRKSILQCGNIGVETESEDIQFNMPELFID